MKGLLDLADPKVADYYGARADAFGKALAPYLGKSIKPSGVAPWLLGGGLTLAATGAAIFATSIDSSSANKAMELLSQYQATTDSATATSLHDSIYTDLMIANSAGIGKWVGVTAGPLLAALGGAMVVRSDPTRIFNEYAKGQFARSADGLARFRKALDKRMTNWVIICPLEAGEYRVGDSTRLAFPAVVKPSDDLVVRYAEAAPPLYLSARGRRSQGILFLDPWKVGDWRVPSLPAETPLWATTEALPRFSATSGQKIASPSTSIASKSTSPFLHF